MKEYICKKDLMSQIERESRAWGEDYDSHQILGDIEDFPTVTTADICREFAEKLKEKYKRIDDAGMVMPTYESCVIEIDEALTEMEREKMKELQGMLSQIQTTIEKTTEIVCEQLCKYRETADDDFICDYIREHGECPLDRLN